MRVKLNRLGASHALVIPKKMVLELGWDKGQVLEIRAAEVEVFSSGGSRKDWQIIIALSPDQTSALPVRRGRPRKPVIAK